MLLKRSTLSKGGREEGWKYHERKWLLIMHLVSDVWQIPSCGYLQGWSIRDSKKSHKLHYLTSLPSHRFNPEAKERAMYTWKVKYILIRKSVAGARCCCITLKNANSFNTLNSPCSKYGKQPVLIGRYYDNYDIRKLRNLLCFQNDEGVNVSVDAMNF